MKLSRNQLIKKIYDRLVQLDSDKTQFPLKEKQIAEEVKKLRVQLQDVMNSQCPIFEDLSK